MQSTYVPALAIIVMLLGELVLLLQIALGYRLSKILREHSNVLRSIEKELYNEQRKGD